MRNYVIRRIALLIPTVLAVCILVFSLMHIIPGDVVLARLENVGLVTPETIERLRSQLGIDRSFAAQLGDWLWGLVRGDLGVSLWTLQPVTNHIFYALPISIELVLGGMLLGILVGVPLGVVSAMRHNTPVDNTARTISVLGLSVPDFWIATILLLYLSRWLGYAPPIGYSTFLEDPLRNLQQLALPMAILGFRLIATTARMTRSTMLEVLHEDYIRTARSKGLRESSILHRHALRNALLPVVTLQGTHLGYLLGGTIVLENIFSLPGMGKLAFDSINRRDYTQLQGTILFLAFIQIGLNLFVDVCYSWLDPRIRYR